MNNGQTAIVIPIATVTHISISPKCSITPLPPTIHFGPRLLSADSWSKNNDGSSETLPFRWHQFLLQCHSLACPYLKTLQFRNVPSRLRNLLTFTSQSLSMVSTRFTPILPIKYLYHLPLLIEEDNKLNHP